MIRLIMAINCRSIRQDNATALPCVENFALSTLVSTSNDYHDILTQTGFIYCSCLSTCKSKKSIETTYDFRGDLKSKLAEENKGC